MLGVMMLTFVLFFAFVVNTGMLVHAKINLQNAADLAAYAGAAVQARQLNQISFLNYEMRRQYKKFLFRYYVLGNIAQCGFPGNPPPDPALKRRCQPQNGGGGEAKTPMSWSPDGVKNYGTPAVCIITNAKDNICQLAELPDIARVEGGGAFDTLTDILGKYLDQIGSVQKQNCVAIGMGNRLALQSWLWNLDPDWRDVQKGLIEDLPSSIEGQTQTMIKNIYAVISSLGRGLGLVPKEIFLHRRIKTLESYVNTEPQKGVTFEDIQEMKNRKVPEPPAYERTIQAFLSAYYTLGNHTFSGSTVQMDEIMNQNLLRLGDNTAQFGAFAIDFPAEKNQGSKGNCVPDVHPDHVSRPIPLGVYKDPTILTYYAIRLKAKASLLFSPFGDLTLTAYAAAQPFGSRIGPSIPESQWTRPHNLDKNLLDRLAFNTVQFSSIPNLPIRQDDTTQIGNGWDTQEAMLAMHQAFQRNNGSTPKTIEMSDLDRAYHFAMAPNPGEGKAYNIPYDGDDTFVRNYDSQGMLAFWAPIFPLSKMANMKSELDTLIRNYWPDGDKIQQSTRERMIKLLTTYLDRLQKNDGERYDSSDPSSPAESFQIVRLANPTHTRGSTPKAFGGSFHLKDLNTELRTSWNDLKEGSFRGRIGYSVKMVSFPYLMSGKLKTSPNRSTMNNGFDPDPETDQDLPFIKH